MSTTYVEQSLRFRFDDEWSVLQYDDAPCYRNAIAKLEGTKAVDFVGVRGSGSRAMSVFMEVKDFRGHRIENKARLKDGELAIEVAHKVRDTIAGVIGACRREADLPFLDILASSLGNPKRVVRVVLWLEEDRSHGSAADIRRSAHKSVLLNELKAKLSWLHAKVLVESMPGGLEGVRVSNLPGAGQP